MNQQDNVKKSPEKKKNKVVSTIVNIVLVLAIVFAAFCAFTAFMSKSGGGVPSILGVKFMAIQSDSMNPTFKKGDMIVDTSVKDPSKLEVGDVITFWTIINGERVLNTHRIVEVKDYGNYIAFVTRGDNKETNTRNDDMEVHQNEIVGQYKFHIGGLGSFIDFLQTSTGFLLVIVLPVAVFFIWQLIQFFRSLFAYQAEKVRLQYQASMDQGKQQNDSESNDNKSE